MPSLPNTAIKESIASIVVAEEAIAVVAIRAVEAMVVAMAEATNDENTKTFDKTDKISDGQ